ncbi:MFS transporter [Actinoplanes sp. NPDC051851]|uniref:MFS transporter n=1 Tax=Actinoplanes sp. NPDC051851 TaxID=3154753 RepID=UPI003427113E
MLLAALDQTAVATALRTIVADLDPAHGITRMSWIVTAYVLAAAATTPLYGRLSDMFGRRPCYTAGMTLFLAGSLAAGLAQSLDQLIAARAVQGAGAGGLIGLSFAVVADLAPGRSRGRYQGYFGAVFAVGSVAGPLLGGFLAQQQPWPGDFASWRWVFLLNLPLGLVGLAMALPAMSRPSRKRSGARVDVAGALLLVGGVCTALLVAEWGGQRYRWTDRPLLATATTAAVLLVTFVLWERHLARRADARPDRPIAPLLQLRLLGRPVLRLAVPVAAIVGATTFGAIVYISLYLQVENGLDPITAGLHLVPMMAGVLLGSTGSGSVISRFGRYEFFPVAGTCLAAIGLTLLGSLPAHSSAVGLSVDIFLLGLGLGLVTQVLVLAVQNSSGPEQLGAATATVTFFRQLGGAFGASLFGAVLAARLAGASALVEDPARLRELSPAAARAAAGEFADAAHAVFLTAAALMAFAFVLSVRLLVLLRRAGATAGQPRQAG